MHRENEQNEDALGDNQAAGFRDQIRRLQFRIFMTFVRILQLNACECHQVIRKIEKYADAVVRY